MRNRWIITICDHIRPSRSPHLMTSPRPNKVTYGCYPSIPYALRFTKGGRGLMPHPIYVQLYYALYEISYYVHYGCKWLNVSYSKSCIQVRYCSCSPGTSACASWMVPVCFLFN
jgi:hypothetical protein